MYIQKHSRWLEFNHENDNEGLKLGMFGKNDRSAVNGMENVEKAFTQGNTKETY